jgi:hypothetical protein
MTDKELAVQNDAQLMESVLLQGDLSKLTPGQRVSYYQKVCESIGLNPLTRPFDYLNLKGKLTLYAKKDATDQLRNLHAVSIDDIDIVENATQFVVKVKGHNRDGRTDVEIGVVNKTDMQGDLANAQMKAVTKGKRRLTLSLCGLGWLDETEVETIPGAQAIPFDSTGAIESPIDKGICLYNELSVQAVALGIEPEPLPEKATIDQVRDLYADLKRFVSDAVEQAASE